MRINIVTGPWLPVPPLQGGSTGRIWQGLAESFANQGHQVKILCRSYPGQPNHEIRNKVTYIRRGGLPQSTNIYLDLVKDFVYGLTTFPTLSSADILIINDFWLPFFASAFRPDAGKIVIHAGRFPKGQYRLGLYAGVTRFVALSRVIQEGIAQEYPAAISRMKIIPNPIDTSIFSPPTSPKVHREEKTILYVGRVHPEKGIHLLIDAFGILVQKIPLVRLKIVGPVKGTQGGGGEDYFRILQTKAKGLPIDFVDPIFDPYKLADTYRSADLFCYPSLAEKGEAFPVAPLEAMATGLVPIVSNLACFEDYIQEGIDGYFFDHRSEQAVQNLAETFTAAIENWEKTIEIGLNVAQKAHNYSYDQISKIYLDDFNNLLKH
ncbi:MAG: glycosyltransferase family 4 protein [Lyngbya sp.]|nr:glycosyltransferase family 4 protein [Lyngbya sp.]